MTGIEQAVVVVALIMAVLCLGACFVALYFITRYIVALWREQQERDNRIERLHRGSRRYRND